MMLSATKKWRKRDSQNRRPEIIEGVEFRDGIKPEIKAAWSNRHQLSGIALEPLRRHWFEPNGEEGAQALRFAGDPLAGRRLPAIAVRPV